MRLILYSKDVVHIWSEYAHWSSLLWISWNIFEIPSMNVDLLWIAGLDRDWMTLAEEG